MRDLIRRYGLGLLPAAVVFGTAVAGAHAYISATGSGTAGAGVSSLTSPGDPHASFAATNVSVTWTASTIGAAVAASSYTVERYNGSGADLGEASCGAVPSNVGVPDAFGSFSCTDSPTAGTFKYKITAHYRSWMASSGFTNSVSVGATATTVASTMNPSRPNQQVSYTATVTVEPAGTPTGRVRFLDGASTIAGCAEQPLTANSPYRATCDVTYGAPGSHSITARYLGDGAYPSSTSSVLTQTIARGSQSIVFEGLPAGKRLDEGPIIVKAKASSGLPVTFASETTSVCTTSGGSGEKVTFLTIGTCTIKATQAGNEEWSSATEEQSFAITKGNQTITFAKPPGKNLDEESTILTATASSGLAVMFESKTTSICTTSGGAGEKVTFVTTGTCTIKAGQAGSANWNAAAPVEQSFAIASTATALTALSPATVEAGEGTSRVAVSPDGKNVYATNRGAGANTVSQYARNTETGKLTALAQATVATGTEPESVVVSPDANSVYVANRASNTVSQYARNLATGALTLQASVATGTGPIGLAISPDGKQVYAANATSGTLSQFSRNTETGELKALAKATVPAGANAHGILVSPDGKNVYAANYSADTVSEYARNEVSGELTALGTVAAGTNPHDLAISPDGNSMYVADSTESGSVLELARNAETGMLTSQTTIAAGKFTECIVVSPDGNSVYATNEATDNVSQYSRDTETGDLTALAPTAVATGTHPEGIAVSADGHSVYIANGGSGSISQYSR
jgi:DNA-binding beta-propeller fold protein YncE